MHKQTFVVLFHQECTEELVAGWHSQQGKAKLVQQLACGLDTAAPPPLLVYWLDNSGLALECCFQAGSEVWQYCVVGSMAEAAAEAEVVSHWHTDVELFVLVEQADWWAPVGQVGGTALLQAQHVLDRVAGLVLIGTAVGTLVVSAVSDPVLDMEAALESLGLAVGNAELVEAPLFGQDMAEMQPLGAQEGKAVVETMVLTLRLHTAGLTLAVPVGRLVLG